MLLNQQRKRQIILENSDDPSKEISFAKLQEISNNSFRSFRTLASCGDVINLFIKKENNYIKDAFFATEQQACYLTTASANIFCSWIKKKPINKVKKEILNFDSMLKGKSYKLSCPSLEVFADLNKSPSRIECVNLVAKGIKEILEL